jgi:hypothetical protein
MRPFIDISKLKLSGSADEKAEALRQAVAKFEEHIYKQTVLPSNAQADVAALTQQVNALNAQVQSLQITAFPGLGTDHTHAAYGDHVHGQNTFFVKKGSQDAVIGTNTVVFDATFAFSAPPIVHCWLRTSDPYGLSQVDIPDANITVTGFTFTLDSLGQVGSTGTIFYQADGN